MSKGSSSHKPGFAKKRKRERFNLRHPEGRREFSRQRTIKRVKEKILNLERRLGQLEENK